MMEKDEFVHKMYGKNTDDWATPKKFYDQLDNEFHFNFDPCPLKNDGDNAIFIDWNGRVFCNPPYSNVRPFIEKGILEVRKKNAEFVVFLLPVRTDTKWFHDLIYKKYEIRLVKGRLKFGDGRNTSLFPSMIVIII